MNPSWHVDADADADDDDDDDDDGGELKASGLRLSFRAYEDIMCIYIYIYIYVPGFKAPRPPASPTPSHPPPLDWLGGGRGGISL